MKRPLIILTCIFLTTGLFAQKTMPDWFLQAYMTKGLNLKYDLVSYVKPSFLQGDFNGDHIQDIAALVISKKSKKKGILIIHQRANDFYLIGAGLRFGKAGFDDFDDLKWMNGWTIFKDKIAYETKFDNGDIIGTIPRKLKNTGISIWETQDGVPLAGGIIHWDSKKYAWIHQGE